jgi:CRISPR-associated protein Csh2
MIKNRSEILFLYDAKDINPNGDPMDENKPRIDEELGINIVTDVRLKRTIRDYLHDFKKQEILVREIEYEAGKIQDAKLRAEDFLKKDGKKIDKKEVKTLAEMKNLILENILKECIDVRLFGGTIPIEKSQTEKSAITLTGPVQFRMGRSLHKVEVVHIKGTGAFASEAGKEQKTFRDEYVLPYSLICFYGIINENASKHSHLTEEDIDLLLEGIWNGTKNLISRSKIGQMPHLLLRVIYKEENYHIGDLDKKIHVKYEKGMSCEKIRSVKDFKLDVTELWESIEANKDKILELEFQLSPDLNFVNNGESMTSSSFKEALEKNFKATDLHFQ